MMKKSALIIIAVLGILAFISCEKELRDPKLDMSMTQASEMTAPASGTAYVLKADQSGEVLTTFKWSETAYNLANLESTNYTLQMDASGGDFSKASELVTTTDLEYVITVGKMNKAMLDLSYPVNQAATMDFRVRAFKNDVNTVTEAFSETISLTITPYEVMGFVKYIYLIGSATTIGWDNTKALPMTMISDGVFARVETLTPGADNYFKFLTALGFWAPQWGTDASGTLAEGAMVYRPTEDDTDPPGILMDGTEGSYYIEADTINLDYWTFLTSGELYLVGSATTAGWNADNGLPFTEVEPHVFEITTELIDGGMKFLEVPGQWAPQWGTYAEGTGKEDLLAFRPTESVQDPAEVPSPGSGTYKIRVELTTMHYTFEAQ